MELEEILEQTVDQRQKAERAAEDAILKLKIAGQWLPGEESGRSHDQTSSYRSLSEAFVMISHWEHGVERVTIKSQLRFFTAFVQAFAQKVPLMLRGCLRQWNHWTLYLVCKAGLLPSLRHKVQRCLMCVAPHRSCWRHQTAWHRARSQGSYFFDFVGFFCTAILEMVWACWRTEIKQGPQRNMPVRSNMSGKCLRWNFWFSLGSRAATEDRLRNMWNQINKEITVLTEERSKEDRVCAELITWMCQVPAIIQEVLATTAGTPCRNSESANINGHVIGPNSKIGDEHSSLEIEDAPILLEEHQKEVDTSRIDVQNNGVQIKGTQNQYNPHCLSSGELQEAPGEGLGRGQLKLLGEEGTIHNPQVQSGTTPNFLSEQLMSNKQREGNTRGSQMEEIPGHFHHRRSYSSNSCLQGGEDFGIASQHLEYDSPRRKSQASYTAYYHDSLVCGSKWVLQRLRNAEKCSTTAQGPMSTETVLSHHCCFNTWNCARDVQHRYKMMFFMGQHTEDHKWIWRTYILQLLLLYLVLQNFSEEEYLGATTADPKNWCMLTSGVMGMGWGREAILLGSKIITHNHLSIQKEKVWTGMDSQMESLYLVLDMDLAMMLQRN